MAKNTFLDKLVSWWGDKEGTGSGSITNLRAKLEKNIKQGKKIDYLLVRTYDLLGWGYDDSYHDDDPSLRLRHERDSEIDRFTKLLRKGVDTAIDTFLDIEASVKQMAGNFESNKLPQEIREIYLLQVVRQVELIEAVYAVEKKKKDVDYKKRVTTLSTALTGKLRVQNNSANTRMTELKNIAEKLKQEETELDDKMEALDNQKYQMNEKAIRR
jgi:hypothetical protein